MANPLPTFPPPASDLPSERTCRPKRQPFAADAKRLAPLLGVSVRTLRTWDAGGKMPAPVRVGGKTLWFVPEVRAWLAAGAPDRPTWAAMKAAAPKK